MADGNSSKIKYKTMPKPKDKFYLTLKTSQLNNNNELPTNVTKFANTENGANIFKLGTHMININGIT